LFENDSSHMEKGLFFQDPTNGEQEHHHEKSLESDVDSNNFDAFDAEEDLFEEKKQRESHSQRESDSGSDHQYV
jgi:hypothetical protein